MKNSAILTFLLLKLTHALVIYESTLSMNQIGQTSGLQFIPKESQVQSKNNSFTICGRINYHRLLNRPKIFEIENPNAESQSFLEIGAGYPNTWWRLGNYEKGNESFSNWIIKDPVSNDFSVWSTNLWHHLCIGYLKDESRVILVKDGKVYKNNADWRLKNVEVPKNVLDNIYFGRCKNNGCSDHVGSLTDFNFWDHAKTVDQMVSWTNCQLLDKGNVINWETATWSVENMSLRVSQFSKVSSFR